LAHARKNSIRKVAMWTIPPSIEVEIYKQNHPELQALSDSELLFHYNTIGKEQGHTPNRLQTRQDFINIIPRTLKILEIGPFNSPILKGANVYYADTLSTLQLTHRARSLGLSAHNIPNINYVLDSSGLHNISDSFDVIVSSHNIEHYPDLVSHLQQIKAKLNPNGKYFILIPDKRYCFDRSINPSSIADILDAFFAKRTKHTTKSIIEHRALTTHNDTKKHWEEQADSFNYPDIFKIQNAITESASSENEYIDVHAWQFTPTSFSQNLDLLKNLGLIDLTLEAIYETRYGQNEFWAILT